VPFLLSPRGPLLLLLHPRSLFFLIYNSYKKNHYFEFLCFFMLPSTARRSDVFDFSVCGSRISLRRSQDNFSALAKERESMRRSARRPLRLSSSSSHFFFVLCFGFLFEFLSSPPPLPALACNPLFIIYNSNRFEISLASPCSLEREKFF
jgi:Na+/H+ antiporter NhaD/arsenite permease-like protein